MNEVNETIATFERELASLGIQSRAAATIGMFDGVHLGHQQLLRRVVRWADEQDGASVAITFDPHPRQILRPDEQTLYLMPLAERVERIKDAGIEHVAVVTFSRALSQLTPEQFMGPLRRQLGLRHILAGPDFALGRDRAGTVERLAQIGRGLGYDVEVVGPVLVEGHVVSSTAVRADVQSGDVRHAAQLLGRPFALSGVVELGDRRGHTIGFPTANLSVDPNHLLPAHGVYAVHAVVQGEPRPAVMNIGIRPTFGLAALTIEVHLLDFAADLYGESIIVEFVDRLRGEQQFPSIDALVAQIRADVDRARALLTTSYSSGQKN